MRDKYGNKFDMSKDILHKQITDPKDFISVTMFEVGAPSGSTQSLQIEIIGVDDYSSLFLCQYLLPKPILGQLYLVVKVLDSE